MIVANVNFYYMDYLLRSFRCDDVRSVNYQIYLPLSLSRSLARIPPKANSKKTLNTKFKCERAPDKMHQPGASSSANDVVASLVLTIYGANTLTQTTGSRLWYVDRPTFRHVQIGFCGIVKRFPNERVSLELYECGGVCALVCLYMCEAVKHAHIKQTVAQNRW